MQRADLGKPPVLLNSTLNNRLISELVLVARLQSVLTSSAGCLQTKRMGYLNPSVLAHLGLDPHASFMVKCEGNGRGPAPTVTRCQRECVGGSHNQRAKNKSLFSNYCCCDDC